MSFTSQANHSPSTIAPPTASETTTTPPPTKPIILSLPLPLSPHTSLRIQLTPFATSVLAFLTTTSTSTTSSLSPLGSFVYAMPNRFNPSDPLSTPLYDIPGSIDFATRLAKILARRTGMPAYVGWSGAFGGGEVEEEVQGMRVAVEGIMAELERLKKGDKSSE